MEINISILQAGFLSLSTINIWGQIILDVRTCPIHYRVFSNIPDLYPLDAKWHPLIVKIEMSLDIDKSALRGNISPGWEPLHSKFLKIKR